MAYGMLTRTADGPRSVENLRPAQIIIDAIQVTATGSVSLSAGISAANSIATTQVLDGPLNAAPSCSFTPGQLSWAPGAFGANASSNFRLRVIRFK